jgi:hypothetical protein
MAVEVALTLSTDRREGTPSKLPEQEMHNSFMCFFGQNRGHIHNGFSAPMVADFKASRRGNQTARAAIASRRAIARIVQRQIHDSDMELDEKRKRHRVGAYGYMSGLLLSPRFGIVLLLA